MMPEEKKTPQGLVEQAPGKRLLQRFEVMEPYNEDALGQLMAEKKLTSTDLYLIMSVLRLRSGCADPHGVCVSINCERLQSQYGWKRSPNDKTDACVEKVVHTLQQAQSRGLESL